MFGPSSLRASPAEFDVIVPTSSFSAHGLVNGDPREPEIYGLRRSAISVSVNLFGAPALTAKEFSNYRQDVIVGVTCRSPRRSGSMTTPKLLNLGGNRWSFRPEFGISKAWGPWTVELAPSVTFFSNNTDFFGGNTFSQAPIYAPCRDMCIYTFQSGVWMALDGPVSRRPHDTQRRQK